MNKLVITTVTVAIVGISLLAMNNQDTEETFKPMKAGSVIAKRFDKDGNGYLDKSEYEAYATWKLSMIAKQNEDMKGKL